MRARVSRRHRRQSKAGITVGLVGSWQDPKRHSYRVAHFGNEEKLKITRDRAPSADLRTLGSHSSSARSTES